MDKKALRLESRFSISPNCLGYCGRESAANEFIACITKGECARVPEEVTKFIVLHPYLKTLSSITGLNFLSYPVIEGYWIGNKILNKAKPEDYDLLLDHFLDQGVPDFFVEELRQNKPRAFIPSHLFQVLHIGVGKASGAVPFNLESINNCMIRWGEITKLQKNKAIINLHSLKKDGNKYTLFSKTESIPFRKDLTPSLKQGVTVAVHWNVVIKKLTSREAKNLLYWTQKVCDSLT